MGSGRDYRRATLLRLPYTASPVFGHDCQGVSFGSFVIGLSFAAGCCCVARPRVAQAATSAGARRRGRRPREMSSSCVNVDHTLVLSSRPATFGPLHTRRRKRRPSSRRQPRGRTEFRLSTGPRRRGVLKRARGSPRVTLFAGCPPLAALAQHRAGGLPALTSDADGRRAGQSLSLKPAAPDPCYRATFLPAILLGGF